jgi:uncharacterized protein with FMN-binding domain
MKKFFISALFIGGFTAYAAYNYFTTNGAQAVTVSNTTPAASTSSLATTQQTSAVTQPIAATPTTPSGEYTDGTYTGSVENAYYGNIQVQAVIAGGKLTDVVFLQYPNDRSTSRSINQDAMPQLKAEAIQSQSATVDGVSGASDSSTAFEESLASALSQAKA